METTANRQKIVFLVVLFGMAVNLAFGLAAIQWNLPIYLDAIGTIGVTLLCGWQTGAMVGVFSSFEGGLVNPHLPYFAFTHIALAAAAGCSARHGGFRNVPYIVLTGLALGVVAAVVSAPAVALAFGDDANGASGLACFLSATREHLRLSFASAEFWVEPVDKILQCLIAAGVVEALPKSILSQLDSPAAYLQANKYL